MQKGQLKSHVSRVKCKCGRIGEKGVLRCTIIVNNERFCYTDKGNFYHLNLRTGRTNPEHKSSGRDFKLGVPSLRFQAR